MARTMRKYPGGQIRNSVKGPDMGEDETNR